MSRSTIAGDLRLEIDAAGMARLNRLFANQPKRIRREVYIAMNQALRDSQSYVAKFVGDRVALKRDVIRNAIRQDRATATRLEATLEVKKDTRPNLKHFAARRVGVKYFKLKGWKQQKKTVNPQAGITYRIARTGPRKLVPQAFVIPEYGFDVFKRHPGIKRGPLKKSRVYGISSWGVLVKLDAVPGIAKYGAERFRKRLAERIRFQELVAAGVIPGGRGNG